MTTADDPGPERCAAVCSLRAAITAANDSSGSDLIRFEINGPAAITPRSPLPRLRSPAISIDARTQPGWRADQPPPVYLDGRRAGDAAGLLVNAADAELRGLAIGGFARYGIGVVGADARRAVIESNWIGMSADGRRAAPNRLGGVAVLGGAAEAQIGASCSGCGNRIAGNSVPGRTGHGVVIGGGGSIGARIIGNVIGLGAADRPLPNDDGVLIVDAAQAEVRANSICASIVAGVELRETRAPSTIDANRIGLTAAGAEAGNDVGVFLGPGAARIKVGALEPNLIAANRVGIAVEQGAREVQLWNNWIGLAPSPDAPQQLAAAGPMPNRERGISVIAGAAEVRIVANQLLAGEYGIVVAGSDTSRISLQRNVIASQGAAVGIDVREAAAVTIGGDRGLGNILRGLAVAVRLERVEEPIVADNRIGAEFADIQFSAADATGLGIELAANVRSATVQANWIGGLDGAAVALTAPSARANLLTRNIYGANGGLDIDLSLNRAAAPPSAPVLSSYEVQRISANQLRSTIRGRAQPGTAVEIYVVGRQRPNPLARARTAPDGTFAAVSLELALGDVRALSVARSGATSEFSPPLPASARQLSSGPGLRWIAITGGPRSPAQALAPLGPSLHAAWRWNPADRTWRWWSPHAPEHLATLQTVHPGDVLALRLSSAAPRNFFSPTSPASTAAARQLAAGLNLLSWTGPAIDGWDALEQLERQQPGLLSVVWQWDPQQLRWRVIWPRQTGAWPPGRWAAPVLALRATRSAVWQQDAQLPDQQQQDR